MGPAQATDVSHDEVMKGRILDAAMQCFTQLGIAKTSIQDIARLAEVSRGTVYRYFSDRQALIDAGIEHGAEQYYDDAARAMDRKDTLSEQMGAFAEVVARTLIEHRTRDRLLDGDDTLMRSMVSDRQRTLRRHMEFLHGYVVAAIDRGEIDEKVDVDDACEWLARSIISLTMMQTAATFDYSKPATVAAFMRKHAVGGLSAAG